jgi:hypothetical protein
VRLDKEQVLKMMDELPRSLLAGTKDIYIPHLTVFYCRNKPVE